MSVTTVISTAQRRAGAARRRARRWGKDCHAAVAIEFVLIIPMLVGLIAFGNEAVGVRLQQKVLQDFSVVTADVIAGYYEHGPVTEKGTTSGSGAYSVDRTSTYSRGAAVTSATHSNTPNLKLLSLTDLTDGMRVLLAEIHPVGDGTKILGNPCSREATVALDSDNPFTCQILALAPTNQQSESTVNVDCTSLPAVWSGLTCTDGGASASDTITNPTLCDGKDVGDGYRITWRFGYDTGGTAKKVCECASSATVQGLTVYDKKLIAILNRTSGGNAGFDLSDHEVPILNPGSSSTAPKLPNAGVLVWAASYRQGLFTGILDPETVKRLTLQSWNWASAIEDPTRATYEAAGVAHVDGMGENMISCYTDSATTTP